MRITSTFEGSSYVQEIESLRVPIRLGRLGIPHTSSRTNGPSLVIMTTTKSIYTHNAVLIRLARTTCLPAHTFLPPPDSSSYPDVIALCQNPLSL
jgi:hypothetical protein